MPPKERTVTQIKRRFQKLDKNKDGSLTIVEMGKLLRQGRADMSDRELELLFQSVDKNGNGRIEFGEFVDFIFDMEGEQTTSSVVARRKPSVPTAGRAASVGSRGSAGSRNSSPPPSERLETPGQRAAERRHLYHQRQSWDIVAEQNNINWEHMKDTFFAYAGRNGTLEGSEFAKMCRDCGLCDERVGGYDIDTIFAFVCSRGQRHMSPTQFQEALELVAEKKGCPTVVVRAKIASCEGPEWKATKGQAPKFHDGAASSEGEGEQNAEPATANAEPPAVESTAEAAAEPAPDSA